MLKHLHYILGYSGWSTTLKECTILHAVVCKILCERGVQVHPPAPPCQPMGLVGVRNKNEFDIHVHVLAMILTTQPRTLIDVPTPPPSKCSVPRWRSMLCCNNILCAPLGPSLPR